MYTLRASAHTTNLQLSCVLLEYKIYVNKKNIYLPVNFINPMNN